MLTNPQKLPNGKRVYNYVTTFTEMVKTVLFKPILSLYLNLNI